MNLRMIKELLRLKYEARLSHQQIALALRISKGGVGKYVGLAEAAGLNEWALIEGLDEQALQGRLLNRGPARLQVVMPDFAQVHRELSRKGVTLMLLWQEYVAAHPGERTWGRTQFFEHYRTFAQSLRRSMRQVHLAGEKLFVDYAGPTISVRDGSRANVFVAAMGASSYTFACATPSQKLQDWIEGLVRALEFVQGVPQLIVPDNARALIADPDRYEPRASDTVLDFARHYGTSVLPARPLKPQDKAKAESAVQVVERWILARLRHQRFESVHEVDHAIAGLLPALNQRPFQKLPGSRASVFAEIDHPALAALPGSRYELAYFKTVKVHIDYHVQVDGHFYSVPHPLVGKTLQVRLTARGVECLHGGRRIAAHRRSFRTGAYTTLAEHLPAAHRAHREWSPSRLIDWGRRIGVSTAEVVERMLAENKHPEHGYRRCLGLLSLARKHGSQRLEAACAIALRVGVYRYRTVKEILANNRDQLELQAPTSPWNSPDHENVRGPGYYQ
jgi:transposase